MRITKNIMNSPTPSLSEQRRIRRDTGIVISLCLISLFLFLGLTDFNTRGEPREALVALAMLQDGNWTLPLTNGVDIAYKPPFFHWCIAIVSTVCGGVTEFTSRFPSALALTVMAVAGYRFFAHRVGATVALLSTLVLLTNFEVHRGGINCRVDMLLTAMIVCALYALYIWAIEKQMKGIPWVGILCLSGAFLTKGPVGMVLPCMVVAVMLWVRGRGFWPVVWRIALVALGACLIPAVWYYAAWLQGGQQFLDLVMMENVLRFLGKMNYASHENPWWYNLMTMATGLLPWTLLLLFSLLALRYHRPTLSPSVLWERLKRSIQTMDDARLFSLLSAVLIFVFYCIPKSKRSVYLLPAYPFAAYFIAEYAIWLARRHKRVISAYGAVIASLGLVMTAGGLVAICGLIPDTIFHGRHAEQNAAFLHALGATPALWEAIVLALPAAASLFYFFGRKFLADAKVRIFAIAMLTASTFFCLDGFYLPRILAVQSDHATASEIEKIVPKGRIYSYITLTAADNRMHPFTINFYTDGRVMPFADFKPTSGYILIGPREIDIFKKNYGNSYALKLVYDSHHRSCDNHDNVVLYEFKRNDKGTAAP